MSYQSELAEILVKLYLSGIVDDSQTESVESAIAAITELTEREVIKDDEKHDNGQKMVNDPASCMDCSNPDERFARNELRNQQRQSLRRID